MKKFMMLACMVALVFGVAANGYAYTSTINDDYIGGDHNGWFDVIGSHDTFNIDSMIITIDDENMMTVDIKTNYVDYLGTDAALGTELGDLFISTDGWKPYGDSEDKYPEDDESNGEDWEYAFDLSGETLYDIRDAQDKILMTDDVFGDDHPNYIYRNDQETQIDSEGLTGSKGSVDSTSTAGHLLMSFDISEMVKELDEFQLAFHWNMTCGNDTIEGAIDPMTAPVPEPSTVLLLGLGLFGVIGISRKRLKK